MCGVYMPTTYSKPGGNPPGPVEWCETLHCMSSVDRETRYIVAALPVSSPMILMLKNQFSSMLYFDVKLCLSTSSLTRALYHCHTVFCEVHDATIDSASTLQPFTANPAFNELEQCLLVSDHHCPSPTTNHQSHEGPQLPTPANEG